MKNIWKLLMVAMMAIAMVGCPQPQSGNNNGDGGESGPTFTSFTGVYSFDASVDSLSGAWGGSPAAPAFSIMLMDAIAIDSIHDGTVTDLKQMPVGSPVYQIQGLGDNSFLTALDGSWKTKYDGVAATVANGRYTVFVDGSKITKTQLKGIGMDFGTDGEKVIAAEDSVDLTGYQPVALALSDNTTDEAYIADLWSARLHKMKSGATYPNAQDTPAKVKFSIKFTGKVGNDNVEWTVKNVEYYTGAKAPYNFYSGSGSGATNEAASAGATLTAAVTGDLVSAEWETMNSGDNVWPTEFPANAKYVKKALLGFEGRWIYFNGLKGTFDLDGNKGDAGDNSGDTSSSAAGAGDTSSSAAGAGDNGSSAAGAGDTSSSAAGAGDTSSSAAAPAPAPSIITVSAPTGKAALPAADVSADDTAWTQDVSVDTTSAPKTKHVADFFGAGKDLDLTSDAILTFNAVIDMTTDNKLFGMTLGVGGTWGFPADFKKAIVVKVDLSNITDVTIDDNTKIVNNFNSAGASGWTKDYKAIVDGNAKYFYYICGLKETQLAKNAESFITFQIVNSDTDETKNSKTFAYALVSNL